MAKSDHIIKPGELAQRRRLIKRVLSGAACLVILLTASAVMPTPSVPARVETFKVVHHRTMLRHGYPIYRVYNHLPREVSVKLELRGLDGLSTTYESIPANGFTDVGYGLAEVLRATEGRRPN